MHASDFERDDGVDDDNDSGCGGVGLGVGVTLHPKSDGGLSPEISYPDPERTQKMAGISYPERTQTSKTGEKYTLRENALNFIPREITNMQNP